MVEEYKNEEVYVTSHPSRITHHASRIPDTMSEIVNQSLQKIVKGTGIVFISTIIGMPLGMFFNSSLYQDDPMLIIEVSEIKGKCPVYKKGDKIVIDGPEIVLEKTDAICIHALAPLLHYVVALRDGADPRKLGLSKEKDVAYIQCVDPGEPYYNTEGGTVIFKCYRTEE